MKRINRKQDEEEGAMGVGTLIVFIAMVLVAAIAASVLIDTANNLQQQAQRTGEEAIQEVSSSFTVLDVYGEASGENVTEINLKVSLAAGASAQDLTQTVIQVQSADDEVNLQAADSAGEEEYGYEGIISQEGDETDSFVEPGDIYKLTIDLSSDGTDMELGTQARLDINIIPKHGTPTYEQITTPSTITNTIVDL